MSQVLRFEFRDGDRETVEADVALAIFAAECVYGRPRVRMEASYLVGDDGGSCVLEIAGEPGESVARVFAGLCAARFGEESYDVERLQLKHEPVGARG